MRSEGICLIFKRLERESTQRYQARTKGILLSLDGQLRSMVWMLHFASIYQADCILTHSYAQQMMKALVKHDCLLKEEYRELMNSTDMWSICIIGHPMSILEILRDFLRFMTEVS